jgi:hypothetical protein
MLPPVAVAVAVRRRLSYCIGLYCRIVYQPLEYSTLYDPENLTAERGSVSQRLHHITLAQRDEI